MNEKDPLTLFSMAFGLSSVAGLAAILRNGKVITLRLLISATLNSGLFGLGVAMVWYNFYGGAQYPWFMLGVSLLAGLGGASLMDFVYELFRESATSYLGFVTAGFAKRTHDALEGLEHEDKKKEDENSIGSK